MWPLSCGFGLRPARSGAGCPLAERCLPRRAQSSLPNGERWPGQGSGCGSDCRLRELLGHVAASDRLLIDGLARWRLGDDSVLPIVLARPLALRFGRHPRRQEDECEHDTRHGDGDRHSECVIQARHEGGAHRVGQGPQAGLARDGQPGEDAP